MSRKSDDSREDLLAEVFAHIGERLPADEAGAALAFARRFYGQVDLEDLQERSTQDLYGAVLSQWHFARKRKPGEARVRVFNPKPEEHGWQSTHTIVEIVHDDMPFLVDSITMEVNRLGLILHLIIHPVMPITRDAGGLIQCVEEHCVESAAGRGADHPSGQAGTPLESVIHVEVDRRTDRAHLEALQEGIVRVLSDVRGAVADWLPMRKQLESVVATIDEAPPKGVEGTEEASAFLKWLLADNFTLLGFRSYELKSGKAGDLLQVVPGSGLGILRDDHQARATLFALLPEEALQQARAPNLLVLTKANARATVHRPGYLDYVGVKQFDKKGTVVGEWRFLGLFTSSVYSAKPVDIPLIRHKVRAVANRAGFRPRSHVDKALTTILEQYPRDELFQISEDDLFRISTGILRLGERQRTRLFIRRDAFCRFYSCLVYVPRESYNTELRRRMQNVLMEALHGESAEFDVKFSESALARILIIVRLGSGALPEYDEQELEARLVRASRRWEDDLRQALNERCGEERGNHLFTHYGAGFPAAYRDDYPAAGAVGDIELMETLASPNDVAMKLYVPLEAAPGQLHFKMFQIGNAVPLSVSLPMLEHMGVRVIDERPYEILRENGPALWLHDIGLTYGGSDDLDVDQIRELFQDAFLHVWRGEAENDDFNRLVLMAGLGWRQVALFRAYARYMRQAGSTFSQAYVEQTLAQHAGIVRQLLALFEARFDPDFEGVREAAMSGLVADVEEALDAVVNLDEDRIMRQLLALIQATLRTNYYQRAGDEAKTHLSFKFDPARVPGLPEPRPMFEIFVYSPRMEGVHLRGGRVARGGLRWSDRMEDFRTEVLGLVKAQMVKNTVIVPVGSKGGFVVRNPPPPGDREAFMKEGVDCYRTFLSGMLDLTDNMVGGTLVPPERVVRQDGDDPYLVVAADKGTATFSDYANAVSESYGFWLGDAFASGGSAGYDHKKMGITARGAWESVKRHFREMGVDTQTQPFSVVGIGDMSGDVFGNGMLLSEQIRLVAAFDHRHVFIDPDPDPTTSFKERQRIFALPRSSWEDYDASLLSKGGGVFPRSAKVVKLSAEARAVLGIEATSLTPTELIRAILLAPVDLLYNGGIGTYIKSSRESHADVGDRANEAIRVNGNELRCKVIGEGGNLGATQLGRVEFALAGGRVYTDAIDNSAGVDCSDHEVNIKILLNAVVEDGDLTSKQRNKLLADMTDEVAQLCLRDNYFQTQVLSVSKVRGVQLLDEQMRYMRSLSNGGRLNRRLEFLPFDEELVERKASGIGLTSPELAVLLAYAKMQLFEALLDSDVPEDPYIRTALHRYFPRPLRERYPDQIERHPLRREIIATHVVNSMLNRVGPTFVFRMQEETGASAPDIVRAYLASREVFGLVGLWQAIEALDSKVEDAVQTAMTLEGTRLILRGTQWFLHYREHIADLGKTLARFSGPVAALSTSLSSGVSAPYREALETATGRFAEQGVPEELAGRVALLDALFAGLDIVEVAGAVGVPAERAAQVYFEIGGRLEFLWLAALIAALPADNHWQGLARGALRDDLSAVQRDLAATALRLQPEAEGADVVVDAWMEGRDFALGRYRSLCAEVRTMSSPDMAMLSVALRAVRGLL